MSVAARKPRGRGTDATRCSFDPGCRYAFFFPEDQSVPAYTFEVTAGTPVVAYRSGDGWYLDGAQTKMLSVGFSRFGRQYGGYVNPCWLLKSGQIRYLSGHLSDFTLVRELMQQKPRPVPVSTAA